jgi:hypothetical protein
MSRPPDLPFEALVEATGATIASERGALNAALRQIRESASELTEDELALEIRHRADVYRKVFPNAALTPTALAKHWERMPVEAPKPTYPDRAPSECQTCGGVKLVLVGYRPAPHLPPGHNVPEAGFEEYAPCPDCNHDTDGSFWRVDGTRFRVMDPAEVRQRMQG